MGKSRAPAMQFYIADYIQDTRMLSLPARGAWMECLCQMWISPERGKIEYSCEEFARLFGCGNVESEKVIFELMESGICDALPKRYQDVTKYNQKITIMSRRMLRDEKLRKSNADKQNRYRRKNNTKKLPESNPNSNPPSSDYSLHTTNTTVQTPISPLKGEGRVTRKKNLTITEQKQKRVKSNTDTMIRIGKWFGRQPSTLWSVYEQKSLDRLFAAPLDIKALETYYTADIPKDDDYRRRNLETLLNNWISELDRARTWINQSDNEATDAEEGDYGF